MGQPIKEILFYQTPSSITNLDDCNRNEFDDVHLWTEDEQVSQIGVLGKYKGRFNDKIGIGSTLEDVQELLGKIEENEDDCLMIFGIAGLCFETEWWNESSLLERNLHKKINAIYVFS